MGFSSGAGSSSIGSATDVIFSNLATGQIMGYNASLQKWQNNVRPTQLVEAVNTVAASGATETIPDVTTATISYVTLTASCTFTFPAAAVGKSFMLALLQDSTGGRTATWPGTVKWAGGTAPTLTTTAGKLDTFSFICIDGTNWLGFPSGYNF